MDENDKEKDGYYKGVKIEKLDTVGKPLEIKGTRWRGNYVTTRVRNGQKKKLVQKMVKALQD